MLRVLLVAVLVVVMCPAAQAAPRTVARSGDFTLQAEHRGGEVCLTLRRDRRYQGEACGRQPRSPHRTVSVFPDVYSTTYAAAVGPTVRRAEAEDARGRRTSHKVFAARGFAARFVVIPPKPGAVFVRFYDADGRLLGIDAGPVGYIASADDTQILGDREAGVKAYTEPQLAPTPDQADRLLRLACVDVVNASGGSGVCGEGTDDALIILDSCDGPGTLGAVVGSGIAGLRLQLGSGATVELPAQALPPAFAGRRAVGAEVPAGEAVRSATALDASGRDVAGVGVGLAPSGLPCTEEDRGKNFSAPLVPVAPPAAPVPAAAAGGLPLVVADQGETLCAELGTLTPQLCPAAPVDSDPPRLLRRGATVAGVLSADAARVTLELDRGRDVTVPTTTAPAYTGRWAGKVRFFAAEVPAARTVVRAVVRDARGRAIGVSDRSLGRSSVNRRVLAEQGGVRLQVVRQAGAQPCVTAFVADLAPAPSFCTVRNPGRPIDGPFHTYRAAVVVSCTPRLALAYGRIADGMAVPEVVLAGGRRIKGRRVALPDDDAWFAFAPDAAVERIRAGKDQARLDLPPASAQCGYSVDRAF